MRWEGKIRTNDRPIISSKSGRPAMITEDDKHVVLDRLQAGETQASVAKDYGVSQRAISKIQQSAKQARGNGKPPAKNRSAKTISERAKAQQKEYLRGRRYRAEKKAEGAPTGNQNRKQRDQNDPVEPERTSEKLAKEHNISPATIKRDQLVPPDLSGRFRADFQKISQT